MIADTEKLVSVMREELAHYGELLALLETQQELIVTRSAQGLWENIATISAHVPKIPLARRRREDQRLALAKILGLPATVTFRQLIVLLPANYQPLLNALVEEINSLLFRAQRRLHQNHLLLSRSLDLMKQTISRLFPSTAGNTYARSGGLKSPILPTSAIYETLI